METPTRKGEATRQRIVETALKLFQREGFEKTTLRQLAKEAGCSLGLTYRYFRSKEDIVMGFYQEMAADFESIIAELPAGGKVGTRFRQAMEKKIESLQPYRDTFAALFPRMARPGSPLSIFGEETAALRTSVVQSFGELVRGSSNVSDEGLAGDLATLLFVLHFMVLLYWFHDSSPKFANTREALEMVEHGLGWIGPLMLVPGTRKTLKQIVRLSEQLFQEPKKSGGKR